MIRRHLVRGYNDQIFFAESGGASDKIFKLEMHPEVPGSVVKQEVFSLSDNWIVAIEVDYDNIQNDALDIVEQSLFIVDNQ